MKLDGADKAGLYTDFKDLNQLKSAENRNDPESLKRVAKEFEQLFMNMMMQSMRKANESFGEDNFTNSKETRFFQDMLDNQLTLEMSKDKGIGIAEVLVRQLSGLQSKQSSSSDQPDLSSIPTIDSLRQMLAEADVGRKDIPPGVTKVNAADEARREQTAQTQIPRAIVSSAQSREELPDSFESPEEFVAAFAPLANRAAEELGVEPRVLVAQAALETGWGKFISKSEDGNSSYNLFNIKADERWDGDSVNIRTLEYRDGVAQRERASFRSYESYNDSFDDYVEFLKSSPRYEQALSQANDPQAYLGGLQDAGYATDPHYADKVYEISQRPLMLAVNDIKTN